jgi:hypothetical protein
MPLEILGCELDALPLTTEYLSSAPTMLVFENAVPFSMPIATAAMLSQSPVLSCAANHLLC